MVLLETCPACISADWLALPLPSEVTREHVARFGDGVIVDSAYAICQSCELVFARRRQDASDAERFYSAFIAMERRDYAVYPPPKLFLDNQLKFSERLLERVASTVPLAPATRVLNLRCEAGVHLARLRDEHGVRELHGTDHFDSNLEYGRRDLGLAHLSLADPIRLGDTVQASGFDLILANHQLTHALNPRALVEECVEKLAPGGRILFYNEIDHDALFGNADFWRPGVITFHKQLFERRSLENFLALAGLEIERVWYDVDGFKWAAGASSLMILARPTSSKMARHQPAPASVVAKIRRGLALNRWRTLSGFYALRDFAIRLGRPVRRFIRSLRK